MLQHVAIIMDGNGRWAKKHHCPVITGHRAGAKAAKAIVKHAAVHKIPYLTLYAFSSENWKRGAEWVNQFFDLLYWYLEEELSDLFENQVRLKVIGDISHFPEGLQHLLKDIENRTQHYQTITLSLALSYGGRGEIIRAIRSLDLETVKNLTEDDFHIRLDTNGIPDPDLLIRTSGEMRLSNFLLWQLAYTELYFSPKLWPDFSPHDFDQALQDFFERTRRFGSTA